MRGGRASWSVTRGRFRPLWYNLLTTSVNIDSHHRWPAKSSLVLYCVPWSDYSSALFCFVLIQTLLARLKGLCRTKKPKSRPRGLNHLLRPARLSAPPVIIRQLFQNYTVNPQGRATFHEGDIAGTSRAHQHLLEPINTSSSWQRRPSFTKLTTTNIPTQRNGKH
jgi:hypothetical protein